MNSIRLLLCLLVGPFRHFHAASAARLLQRHAGRDGLLRAPRRISLHGMARLEVWRDIARELYDHCTDPLEIRNAVDDPKLAGEAKAGAAALETFHPLVRPGWGPTEHAKPTSK